MAGAIYNEVYVPEVDVYYLGGKQTFKGLERKKGKGEKKNLIVLPYATFQRLRTAPKGELINRGARDSFEFIDSMQEQGVKSETVAEGVHVYNLLTGLDIAILDERSDVATGNPYDLERKIGEWFTSNEGRPKHITNDVSERVLLRNYGLEVEKPRFLLADSAIVNKGMIVSPNDDFSSKLFTEKMMSLEVATGFFDEPLYVNQFIKIPDLQGGQHRYAIVRADIEKRDGMFYVAGNERIELIDEKEHGRELRIRDKHRKGILGIRPNDMEQYFALQYGILNPDVEVCFITGSQGSGKTLLSYVGAVDQILYYPDERKDREKGEHPAKNGLYKNIFLLKPTEIMGGERRDIGFLPGSMYDKIKPHLMPYIDAHEESSMGNKFPFEEMLLHPNFINDFGKKRELVKGSIDGGVAPDNEMFKMTYSGFMRGRSIKNALILVDEAQNFTPYEMKTIIERVGPGSKIIIMGDPRQFDNPFCDLDTNGLTSAINHYLAFPFSALVNLTKNYRSPASKAAKSWSAYSG